MCKYFNNYYQEEIIDNTRLLEIIQEKTSNFLNLKVNSNPVRYKKIYLLISFIIQANFIFIL